MTKVNQESIKIDLKGNSDKVRLSEIYKDYTINPIIVYLSHFGYIPHAITDHGMNCYRANDWILKNLSDKFQEHYLFKYNQRGKSKLLIGNGFYFLEQDIMINLDHTESKSWIYYKHADVALVEGYRKQLLRFKKKNTWKPKISILMKNEDGFYLKQMPVQKPRLNIEDNYNNDFLEVHQQIKERLSRKNDKGILLLHGKPGTGKTTYLRYLIGSVRKRIIFFPPNLASYIVDPGFIELLISHPNSILVIEDAESIIASRDSVNRPSVSALLNISDGLLSDFLNIQLVCSFNIDISNVDMALTRKGRLIAKYEFKEMEIEKAKALSKKLGMNGDIDGPMTLTEIYNQKEENYTQTLMKKAIGF
ncbi:MAG: AAA family ATPase [Mongoliibacter sp.]|uniref:AAA family ATPase n=1 Tax=Mongoliibacter sp. TaxID=2022438 RepID=UPI0012F26BA6|nr:AAA family ATPase [Mongoliibacter sp.]TVP52961.1 MAG: AAA family ATPase [Mongoliibacter sp.]